MSRVVYSTWFTAYHLGCIGAVVIQDDITGERKAYIGLGDGNNEARDIQRIRETGSKLTLRQVEELQRFMQDGKSEEETE